MLTLRNLISKLINPFNWGQTVPASNTVDNSGNEEVDFESDIRRLEHGIDQYIKSVKESNVLEERQNAESIVLLNNDQKILEKCQIVFNSCNSLYTEEKQKFKEFCKKPSGRGDGGGSTEIKQSYIILGRTLILLGILQKLDGISCDKITEIAKEVKSLQDEIISLRKMIRIR